MKICATPSPDLFSSSRNLADLSEGFTGRYPLNVKFCPLSPDEISARSIDEGPARGVIIISFV